MSPVFPFYACLSLTGFSVALTAYRLALLFELSPFVFLLMFVVLASTLFSLYELWLALKELFGIDFEFSLGKKTDDRNAA